MKRIFFFAVMTFYFLGCKKNSGAGTVINTPFSFVKATVNDSTKSNLTYYNVTNNPIVRAWFSSPINLTSAMASVTFTGSNSLLQINLSLENNDSTLVIRPVTALKTLTNYTINISTNLKSKVGVSLGNPVQFSLVTTFDSTDKFTRIADTALLTLVQKQTFSYFWAFGHPVSGLSRERTSSADVVTTGGSGFGVMAILAGVQRGFITKAEALTRISTIVGFLSDTTKVTRYHGAFSHWINGATGATIPFSPQDNGGDIVETAYMIQGLLCARQYFNSTTDNTEITLRNSINSIWHGVDWNWYRNNQNALYWNWSPDQGFVVNVQVGGWSEALITYVLAASGGADTIPKIVYDNGWAHNGGMKNGRSYYGIPLPLGPDYGGPLFFAHYSFLGINPNSLSDAYADYWTQDTAHAKINYLYCVNNPHGYNGYSSQCWGLTASDDPAGYSAHEPANDNGTISPTAAISSLPYTPVQSMNALRFFYYKLGDKIWGQYGFSDAFNLTSIWFDSDCIAIDQGPEMIMIENYRTGMLWNLFMSCPEVKTGMKNLGFSSPFLN